MSGPATGPLSWKADDALPGFEPPSAWSLIHGRDFVPMSRDRTEDPDDFGYVAAMDAHYPSGKGATRPPLVLLKAADLRAKSAVPKALEMLRERHGMVDPRLWPMPLRKRMLDPPNGKDTLAAGDTLPRIGTVRAVKPDGDRPKALVGVIDYGINVFHERFRDAGGLPRVACHWDQGATAKIGGALPFGREWAGNELAGILKKYRGNDRAALAETGALDFARPGDRPLALRQSHGTAVLDCAAGADPGDAAPTQILAVSLPSVVARESSGSLLTLFLLQGFEYLLTRARAISAAWGCEAGAGIPLYVNISLGISGGPRGGAHPIETGIAGLIAEHEALGGGPVVVVTPAGNRNLAEGHAQAGAKLDIGWRVQPGDRTSNYVDIRITGDGPVTLTLAPPGGNGADSVRLEPDNAVRLVRGGAVIGRAVLERRKNEPMSLGIALAPSDPVDTGRRPAQAGAWRLVVDAAEVGAKPAAQIDAWILRDDSPAGFSDGGRQSYFDDQGYKRYDLRGASLTEDMPAAKSELRQGALNAIATGAEAIVIGGYSLGCSANWEKAVPAPYSAGPLPEKRRLNRGEAVDFAAVSERSRVLGGVISAGTLSGSRQSINGTSIAAPQVVRMLAENAVQPVDVGEFLSARIAYSSLQNDPHTRHGPLPTRRAGKGGLSPSAAASRR